MDGLGWGMYDDETLFGEVDAEDENLSWVNCAFWGIRTKRTYHCCWKGAFSG